MPDQSKDTAFALPKTRSELQPALEAAGIRLRKKWGQCLLVDLNMLDAIVRDAAIELGDFIIEIGPGPGTLTEMLLRQNAHVLAIDIDRGMTAFLADGLAQYPRLTILNADVMGKHNQLNPGLCDAHASLLGRERQSLQEMEACRLAASEFPDANASLRVVANLPYQISAPVMIALLESELAIQDMTLLLQLEVGQKLAAKPGSKEWGLLSLIRMLKADAEVVRKVPASCFWPKPKVESALVRVTPKESAIDDATYNGVKEVAATLFRYRRKSLSKAAQHGFNMTSTEAKAWLERAGVSASDHAERLGLEEFQKLYEALELKDAGGTKQQRHE